MNIQQILKPTLAAFKVFLALFIAIHIINLGLFFVFPIFDAGSILGIPIPFYVFSCGFTLLVCDRGFQALPLLWDILFWYGVAILVIIISKRLFYGLIIVGFILSTGSVLIALPFHRDTSPSHQVMAYIAGPEDHAFFVENQSILFHASGDTSVKEYMWTSNKDGVLGVGRDIDIKATSLSEGDHIITMTASDGKGNTRQEHITIQVFRQRQVLPAKLSVAPIDFGLNLSKDSEIDTMQLLSIRNYGDGDLSWTAKPQQDWIYLTMPSGQTPSDISFKVDTKKLSPGGYKGQIFFYGDNSPTPFIVDIKVCLQKNKETPVNCSNIYPPR